jgi:hypothetical protein
MAKSPGSEPITSWSRQADLAFCNWSWKTRFSRCMSVGPTTISGSPRALASCCLAATRRNRACEGCCLADRGKSAHSRTREIMNIHP